MKVIIALIFLLIQLPYLWNAWRFSPLDHYDWIFIIIASGLSAIRFNELKRLKGQPHRLGIWVIISAIFIFIVGYYKDINAILIASAFVALWGAILWQYGEKVALEMVPIIAILLLSLPSSTYWIEYFTNMLGIGVKIIICLLLSSMFWFKIRLKRLSSLAFWAIFGITILLAIIQQKEYTYGDSILIDAQDLQHDNTIGSPLMLSPSDKFFFGNNIAKRTVYITDNNSKIELLSVKINEDIHSIHPLELCMKSSGAKITARKEKILKLPDGELAYQELILKLRSQMDEKLIIVWYSNKSQSTGNYLFFRSQWTPQERWYNFQLSTPIYNNKAQAYRRLENFLTQACYSKKD